MNHTQEMSEARSSGARVKPRVTPRVALGSTVFAVGLALSTMIFAPIAIAAFVLPYRWRYHTVIQWTYFNIWWLGVTCGLRHRVEGVENIPERPTIILSKHESAWETIALPRLFSPQCWVLKRELLRVPFFGWGLATLRPIAIDRSAGINAAQQVVKQGRARLDDGIWVVIFPEGTRVPPGERRRYKLGGAILAASTQAPVIPIAHDSGDYWPRNSFFKFPGTIRLVIGPAIPTDGLSVAEINERTERWIEATVERLRADPA
jgi:1-acyl-sn-glycerol-3-phosphate acyltransferase